MELYHLLLCLQEVSFETNLCADRFLLNKDLLDTLLHRILYLVKQHTK